jgi:hypothetical protein
MTDHIRTGTIPPEDIRNGLYGNEMNILESDSQEYSLAENGNVMKQPEVKIASSPPIDRILFVYSFEGIIKCFSSNEIIPLEAEMLKNGWKHTATIDPARWIEEMANGYNDPSDMLDELQFSPSA